MGVHRFIVRLTSLFAALLLVSCIDGTEEYWLNADGSGRADIRYSLPATAARLQAGEDGVRAMLSEQVTRSDALSATNCEVATVGDRLNIRVRFTFASARELKQLAKGSEGRKPPSSATHLAGEITVARNGRTLEFSRTIAAGKALAGSMFMPASRFKGRQLRYIVHLPLAAKTSNATTTADEGRTLIWEVPLARAVREPVVTRFTADIPIPRWVYLAAGLVIVTVVGAISAAVRQHRNLVKKRALGG